MKSKIIFGIWLVTHASITPFTFSNLFASSFKEPTHEECRQSIRNEIYLGTLLGGSFLALVANHHFLYRELPAYLPIPACITIGCIAGGSFLSFFHALQQHFKFKTPEKTAKFIAQEEHLQNYKQEIKKWRKMNNSIHKIVHDKQLYVGIAALFAGCLFSYTETDNNNPAFILTVAGIGTIAQKIMSEFKG